ncbi:MAG TPA: LamG-like jellyroll fold domain-containing protein [Rhodothermales bacterium]|nr:LamG-like jellyroll fold domain-containing protein [Rhodothermales bacterium]
MATPLIDQLPPQLPRPVLERLIVERTVVDADFRAALIANPLSALTEFFGAVPPAGLTVEVVEEQPGVLTYVVPSDTYFETTTGVGPPDLGLRESVESQVAALLATDPDFPTQLQANPTTAVEGALNLTLPEGVTLDVHWETETNLVLVLPYAPNQGLFVGPYSLQFDATAARVTVEDAPQLHVLDALTAETWLRMPGAAPAGVLASWSDGTCGWELTAVPHEVEGEGSVSSAAVFTVYAGGKALSVESGNDALLADRWAYVAGVYTGTALQLYVNGVLAASATGGGDIAPFTGGLALGARAGGTATGTYFNGQLHEFRLWGDALDAGTIQSGRLSRVAVEEVLAAMDPAPGEEPGVAPAPGDPAPGDPAPAPPAPVAPAPVAVEVLLAHYAMDEGSGLVLRDTSAFRHDGTLDGAVWLATGTDSPP